MLSMVWLLALILLSLVLIFWSTNHFVDGAAAGAKHMGISSFTIGLTLVALGTSGPEIAVSVVASLNNNQGLAIGNVAGSNNANIGLVLGLAALCTAMPFPNSVLKAELPSLAFIVVVSLLLLLDLYLSFTDGLILLAMLVIGAILWHRFKPEQTTDEIISSAIDAPELSRREATWRFLSGLVILLASTRLLVWGGAELAESLGVSQTFIGLTVIALGTSIPELATTLNSTFKGHVSLAIGNLIGSNIFNLTLVLGLVGVLSPTPVESVAVQRDFIAVLGFTLLLALFGYGLAKKPIIARIEGAILLSLWIGYNALIIHQAVVHHGAS